MQQPLQWTTELCTGKASTKSADRENYHYFRRFIGRRTSHAEGREEKKKKVKVDIVGPSKKGCSWPQKGAARAF